MSSIFIRSSGKRKGDGIPLMGLGNLLIFGKKGGKELASWLGEHGVGRGFKIKAPDFDLKN
jgi:hypothetical protein